MSHKSAFAFFAVSLQRHGKEYEKKDMGREERPAHVLFFKIHGEKL
jgi:hypothetical protein